MQIVLGNDVMKCKLHHKIQIIMCNGMSNLLVLFTIAIANTTNTIITNMSLIISTNILAIVN
jgi:hypothetical protein